MKNTQNIWNFVIWFVVGFGGVKAMQWLLDGVVDPQVVTAFFIGGFLTFVGLSLYGISLQRKDKHLKRAAMDQFIEDQKGDIEQQARIDKEMVAMLKQEHELSGDEQDQRLKALETALKHLRYKK